MTSSKLHRDVAQALQGFGLVDTGVRVLVGFSGGPDSVALTHALLALGYRHLGLAHLDHGLRPSSAQDERFCRRAAAQLNLHYVSRRVDVARLSRRLDCSLEEAGRWARYRFLERAASKEDYRYIAVAHTRNDQAETLLLRLMRGSGAGGLGGIYPMVRPKLVRPLLKVHRREVLDYLAEKKLDFLSDISNIDQTIPRNRVRHQTLPYLARAFNPSIVETLARTADLLREEDDWAEGEAARALVASSGPDAPPGGLALRVTKLASFHPALRRRVVRMGIAAVRGHLRGITARHVQSVLELLDNGKSGRQLCLPALDAGRDFDRLWLRRASSVLKIAPESPAAASYNGYEYPLPVPGQVDIPEARGVMSVEPFRGATLPRAAGGAVVIGLQRGDSALTVRSPRKGDRIRPLGAPGSKPLARYLMEQRVGRERRRVIPVVVGRDEQVLWVAGHGVSESSRAGRESRLLRLSWCER